MLHALNRLNCAVHGADALKFVQDGAARGGAGCAVAKLPSTLFLPHTRAAAGTPKAWNHSNDETVLFGAKRRTV